MCCTFNNIVRCNLIYISHVWMNAKQFMTCLKSTMIINTVNAMYESWCVYESRLHRCAIQILIILFLLLQLIFSGEYTKAMDQDWHSGHFSCWNCDMSLTGHRYILREEHPYCIKCYENLFANSCEECKVSIGTDSKVSSIQSFHWYTDKTPPGQTLPPPPRS